MTTDNNAQTHVPQIDKSTLKAVGAVWAVGIGGVVFIGVWTVLLVIAEYVLFGGVTREEVVLFQSIATLLGAATLVGVYFRGSKRELSTFDLNYPTKNHLWVSVLGVVGLIVISSGIGWFQSAVIGIEGGSHSISAQVESGQLNPELLLALIPISMFCIAPGEELIFRYVVQKSLYPHLSKLYSVIVASLIFGSVHLPTYMLQSMLNDGSLLAGGVSVITVMILSLGLGYIYARTENLLLPIITHGAYNGIVFANLYMTL
jgi:membrane protease YdiL (CAAX protease family)